MNERNINKNLLQDKLFEVGNMQDHLMTVVADNLESAEELYCTSKEIIVSSVLDMYENISIKDLKEILQDAGADLHEILKTPQDLLQELLGEDYIIQPTFSNKHFTEFIVVDNGIEFSFQINNNDYNVFNVMASGTFFANNGCVKYWNKFLDLCDQVRDLIYDYNE